MKLKYTDRQPSASEYRARVIPNHTIGSLCTVSVPVPANEKPTAAINVIVPNMPSNKKTRILTRANPSSHFSTTDLPPQN